MAGETEEDQGRIGEQLPVASWKRREGWAGEAQHNVPTPVSGLKGGWLLSGLLHPAASRSCLTLLNAIVPAADSAFIFRP